MPTTATHSGHCQVCGRMQLLPGGKLSKHGYSVDFGFFNGVCMGAEHLPFEQDISLIEAAIDGATKRAESLRKESHKRRGMTDPANVIYNAYDLWGKRYSYQTVPAVVATENKRVVIKYTCMGKERTNPAYTLDMKTEVKSLNGKEADRLDFLAKQAEDYVKWQQSRIKNWKPMALIPRQ